MGLTLSAPMRLYRHFNGILQEHLGGSIAIGNFDGVHLGHQEVIKAAGKIAKKEGNPWGVLTFEPHPRSYFNKDAAAFRLTPFHLKARYINELGVDFLVVLQFNHDLAKMSPEDFITTILDRGFQANHIVSGSDFVFGNQRRGTVGFLKEKGAKLNFESVGVTQVMDGSGEVISSTRVRDCLVTAEPAEAAELLGRGFEIEGRVVKGDQRGRKIGFPTANIVVSSMMQPAIGGYAVRAGLSEGNNTIWYDGIANLGYRPTFGGTTCLLETHIFDFNEDIYGKHLRVALVGFIRPEVKFDGINELQAQITSDTGLAKLILSGKPPEFR